MPATQLRIGVIGAGNRSGLALHWHQPGGRSVIAACADPDCKNLAAFERQVDDDIFTTAAASDLYARPDIDAIAIVSPDWCHEEQAVAALNAGKHVFCEKPMAITIEGCDNILAAQRRSGRKLMVGFNMRYMAIFRTMKEVIDSGAIGEIKAVWVRHFVGQGGNFYFHDWHSHAPERHRPAVAEGLARHRHDPLADRPLHLARYRLRQPRLLRRREAQRSACPACPDKDTCVERQPDGHTRTQCAFRQEIDVEDNNMVLMELEGGVKAAYLQCHFTPDYHRNYTIIGTEGRLENSEPEMKVWVQDTPLRQLARAGQSHLRHQAGRRHPQRGRPDYNQRLRRHGARRQGADCPCPRRPHERRCRLPRHRVAAPGRHPARCTRLHRVTRRRSNANRNEVMFVNSRQRLLNTLRREPVDRVPISTYEMVGWNWDAWENQQPAYRDLMQLIRDKTDCLYMTSFPTRNRAEQATVSEWDESNRHVLRRVLHTPRGDLTSTQYSEDGINTTWRTERLLKTDEDVERFLSLPRDMEPADLSSFPALLERLGDHGIPLVDIADPICIVAELFEFSEFMLRAYTQPEQITALLEHVAPSVYAHLDHLLAHGVGPLFRVIGAEYVTPPYLPPSRFERFVVGYTGPMIERIRAHGQFARLHCHGRLAQALPMIVAMGVDSLDPVEAPPSGDIALADVKRLYGDKLCLFGNLQLRDLETLPADEMRQVVRRTLEAGKPGGGFVIMPTACPINANLSPIAEQNYRVFIETALDFGKY